MEAFSKQAQSAAETAAKSAAETATNDKTATDTLITEKTDHMLTLQNGYYKDIKVKIQDRYSDLQQQHDRIAVLLE